jgi:SNF2 family DNA or RNA helicase
MAAGMSVSVAQVSAKHKVFAVPFSPALYNVIPGCHILGDKIVVPHTIDTTRLARNLGFHVPSPIRVRYDWCGDTPFEAQEITAALMTMNPRAFILSEIGTGKTRAALYAIDFLLREGIIKFALVTAPLSTLSQVWDKEIFKFFPHLKTEILHGSRKQRREALARDADIYIINHDGIETIQAELCAKTFGAVVIDELSYFRNGTTDRWKSANKICAGRPYVWGLTGSPTPNEPCDAYSQVKLLRPEAVPKYFKHFKELTMTQFSQFRWVAKPTALDMVYAAMQPGVRYLRKEVAELPETCYKTVDCPLTAEQAKVYKQLYDKSFHAFQQGQVTALNEGVLMSKLLQVVGGWVYTAARATVTVDNSARTNALLELLEEADGKCIVFVEFIHAVRELHTLLTKKGIVCETITGETALGERNRVFSSFQSPGGPRVLVAHPRCMSHGLTLTEANTVIWFLPSTSLETYQQANGRITRPGQTRKTLIVHLCCGSAVERKLYQRLQNKAQIQGTLLEMFEQTARDV